MARPKHLKYIVLTYELLTSGLSDKEQKVLGNIIGVIQGGGRYRFDNKWIADFLCTQPNSASRIISGLQSKGLVEVTLIKKEGTNAIDHRIISLTERCINAYVDTPLNTSVDTPLNTSVNHNNKEYNIKDNNIFVRFWDLYDYKVRKKDALKAWNKIDPKYHNTILTHVKHFVKYMPAFDSRSLRKYIKENEPGIKMEHDLVCADCTNASSVLVQMSREFFWPT